MTTGQYAGFSKLELLSSSNTGIERWSATNTKGEHGELFVGGAELIAAANDLPQGGIWGVVLSGIEEGKGWALIPGEIVVSLDQLKGKLSAPAAFSVGLMLLESLDPVHVNWRAHRRFNPRRMGFDKDGALSVRPALDDELFQDPSENSDPRATDCLMVGGVVCLLMGGDWPPAERNTEIDFAPLDPSRAKLSLTGMLRSNSKVRLQPARHALQALTAALQGVDAELELKTALEGLGITGSIKSDTPILPLGTDSKTNSDLIQAFTDSVSPTSESKWEAATSPISINLGPADEKPKPDTATDSSSPIRVELPTTENIEKGGVEDEKIFGDAIPGSSPISSDPFRMVIPKTSLPPKIEATLPIFALDLDSIDVLAPLPDITDESEIIDKAQLNEQEEELARVSKAAEDEALAVVERVAKAEAKAKAEEAAEAKAKAIAEEKKKAEAKAKAIAEEKEKAEAKAAEAKAAKEKAKAEAKAIAEEKEKAEAKVKATAEEKEKAEAKAAKEKAKAEAKTIAQEKKKAEAKAAKERAKAKEEALVLAKRKKEEEAEAIRLAKEEAKKLRAEIAAFEADKAAEEERIRLVAATKAKARAKASAAQETIKPEDLSFETDTTSPMIQSQPRKKRPKKEDLSPKSGVSWPDPNKDTGILSRDDDVSSDFSIGVGVGQKDDVDEDLGPGKWVESGRSAEELARDLPSVFSREMDFGPEKDEGGILSTIKWVTIIALAAFSFVYISGLDNEPAPEVPPNQQVRERLSTSSRAATDDNAFATITSNVDGARVTFDGESIGRQPVELTLPADSRSHQLCVSKGGRQTCIDVTTEELASREPYQVTIE
jgi:hypothetical protein